MRWEELKLPLLLMRRLLVEYYFVSSVCANKTKKTEEWTGSNAQNKLNFYPGIVKIHVWNTSSLSKSLMLLRLPCRVTFRDHIHTYVYVKKHHCLNKSIALGFGCLVWSGLAMVLVLVFFTPSTLHECRRELRRRRRTN